MNNDSMNDRSHRSSTGISTSVTPTHAAPTRGSTSTSAFAARQMIYSCIMTAFLFGFASILSPSVIGLQQEQSRLLQEPMMDDLQHVHRSLVVKSRIDEENEKGDEEAVDTVGGLRRQQNDSNSLIENKNAVATPIVKDAGKYAPVSCDGVLDGTLEKDNKNENRNDPNDRMMHARQVIRDDTPNFWISLHNQEFDHTRWIIMTKGDYYETVLSEAFSHILQQGAAGGKEQRVVDVGGNIGFFSLLSASNGPKIVVDAFEPNPKNRLRFCESLRLNQWNSEYYGTAPTGISTNGRSQVNIYPFGVGQEEGTFSFLEHNNPGQGKFLESKPKASSNLETTEIRVVQLDEFARARGWLDNNNNANARPDIAILKVDVEGLDNLVIKGAAELIGAKIIRNIFMELTIPRHKAKRAVEDDRKALRIIQQAGYTLHRTGRWKGPNNPIDVPHDDTLVEAIIDKTKNEKTGTLNLWWVLEVPTSATPTGLGMK